jgi:tape measure domain-containing protein
MSVEVDSVIVDLEARIGQYRTNMQEATALHRKFREEVSTPANDQGMAATAANAKRTAKDVVQSEEQATQKVATTRKVRSDAAKQADAADVASAKAAAKAKADAAKLAAKEEATAAKEAARAVAAAEREKQAAIAASERVMAQAAAAEARFQAQQTRRAEARFYASGPQMFEARARELRATQAAIIPTGPRRPLEISSPVLTRAAGFENGQNPFQAAANATGGVASAQNAEIRAAAAASTAEATKQDVAGAAAAREKAIAEAEINDRLIAQVGLKAQLLGADKADAVAINDQLFALQQFGRYRALGLDEASAQLRVDAELLAIEEKRVRAAAEQAALVEAQMRAQSGAIASKISGAGLLTGALVGGLGAAEISHLNDRYIELSNSLKVAGVSAAEFDAVQQHLLATANKNGTNINALADVFRSASLGAHDLGASQGDLLKLTDAASNALRIQGVSASKAQGSLLQLGHAFESGRVNAREFNSLALNLYPILQAAAAGSDQFGGSVAKLRQEIIAGNVSSRIFFDAIIKGSGDLEERAGKATLTTAQGFTSLTNALVIYFGEADKAQGVSAALGSALKVLGANLDTLIPAIAAVGTALTVGYITRMAQAAIATQGLGASILGAFGGPVGLAITAVTLAIAGTVIAANQAHEAAIDAAEGLKAMQDQSSLASSGVKTFGEQALGAIPHVNSFAGAVGNLADQFLRQAYAARVARIDGLKAQLDVVAKKRDDALAKTPEGEYRDRKQIRSGDYLSYAGSILGSGVNASLNFLHGGYTDDDNRKAYTDYNKQALKIQSDIANLTDLKGNPLSKDDLPEGAGGSTLNSKDAKKLASLEQKLAGYQKAAADASGSRLATLNKQIADTQSRISNLKAGYGENAGIGGRGRAGPSEETLAKRQEAARKKAVNDEAQYNADLRKAQLDYLQQQADLTDDGAKRADLERQRVRFAAEQYAKEIAAQGPVSAGGTGKYTAPEVATLQKLNTDTANLRVQSIDQAERLRQASDARSIDANNLDLRKEELQAQEGLADTLAKRRDIANQLLDIEYQQKENALKAVLSPDSKATAAERLNAENQLYALPGQKALAQQGLDRNNQSAGQSYAAGLTKDPKEILGGTEVKVLQDFNSGLDQTVTKALKLHGIFGDIIGDLVDMAIKQALIAPIANSLFPTSGGTGSGGGGLLSGILSGIRGISPGSSAGSSLTSFVSSTNDVLGASMPSLSGARANGGPVASGGTYLVGERGPELLRMGAQGGSITPNHAITMVDPNGRTSAPQASGTTINQTIRYSGAVDIADKSYVQQIALAQHMATQQAIAQGNQQTLAAGPGYLQQQNKLA